MKELIKEVERLNEWVIGLNKPKHIYKLEGIKQTVEAVESHIWLNVDLDSGSDWQKLKKLLGVKEE